VRARKLSFSAESVEAAHIFGQSRSRAEYVQNLSAIAFDTAENEFLQVRLLFSFENASKCCVLLCFAVFCCVLLCFAVFCCVLMCFDVSCM